MENMNNAQMIIEMLQRGGWLSAEAEANQELLVEFVQEVLERGTEE